MKFLHGDWSGSFQSKHKLIICCSLIFCTFFINIAHAQNIDNTTLQVKYALMRTQSKNAELKDEFKFDQYFYEMLKLALEKSTQAYELVVIDTDVMMQARTSLLLQDGQLDVHWLTTDKDYEAQLLPIRIPLLKGLIGWRLLLIHQQDISKFENINTVEALKKLMAGQGLDWPDTKVLEQNKFKVDKVTQKGNIMNMLEHKRIDYYPRSMMEIWSDIEYFQEPNVVIENHLALSYPLATYFFVNKNNTALQAAINLGLNRAIDDGSFDLIFHKFFANVLAKANFAQRKVFYLQNNFMSEQTPLNDKRLWFSPLNQ